MTMTDRACAATIALALCGLPLSARAEEPETPAEADAAEIIVTAQGRAQSVSDVPLAIAVSDAAALRNSGATDIRQLAQIAPSLLVSSTGTEASGAARVRGIGTVGDNPGLESSVATFVDGVYRARSGVAFTELGEVDRIELLRGPQGTLFGRNASAGLINVVTRRPAFTVGGHAEASVGNFDYRRLAAGLTGPLSPTLAARIDGVRVTRDGFHRDAANDTRVNDRNRWLVRGQLLWGPHDRLSLRLIGDYARRTESCCAAVYLDRAKNPSLGNLNEPASPLSSPDGNNIITVLRDLGQNLAAFNRPYDRDVSVSPGRTFAGLTTDGGVSLQADVAIGAATLTAITAWRGYDSAQAADFDYSSVDILYRADDGRTGRGLDNVTQELRLQGKALGGGLDWLVGGYFGEEHLDVRDATRFGGQYGRFTTCRIISGGGFAAYYDPAAAGCLNAAGRALVASPAPGGLGAANGAIVLAGLDRLDGANEVGPTGDIFRQTGRNLALFTHNILRLPHRFEVTLGARYTWERKRYTATFGNDNAACPAQQAALTPLLSSASAGGIAGSLIALTCQSNNTTELDGVTIRDRRSEGKLTGTAALSWRPVDRLLAYASYARGYKAGGFNLDKTGLKSSSVTFASRGGAQALVGNLRFDPETVDSYELGAKLVLPGLSVNVAAFREDFRNFQLNTFNGAVFLVQTVNGCDVDLGGTDRDTSAATGACPKEKTGYGVRSQGVEIDAALRPVPDLAVNLGLTYASARYRGDLVGDGSGAPLDPVLRKLPGDNLSNAPEIVATTSAAWTPSLGGGLSALVYADARTNGDYNTGSDLYPQKEQDGFTTVNARIGVRAERWSVELWVQNLFDTYYRQVVFGAPVQAGAARAPFTDPQFPGGRQIFGAFLGEPRTFGLTLRGGF